MMRTSVMIALLIACINGCFYAPTPPNVRYSGISISRLRQVLLSSDDVWDIYYVYLDGMMRRLHRLDAYHANDDAARRKEWRDALTLLNDAERKAREGWPRLKADPTWLDHMQFSDFSPQEVVLIGVYSVTASAANIPDNPIAEEYRQFFDRIRPTKESLLQKWSDAAGSLPTHAQ